MTGPGSRQFPLPWLQPLRVEQLVPSVQCRASEQLLPEVHCKPLLQCSPVVQDSLAFVQDDPWEQLGPAVQ